MCFNIEGRELFFYYIIQTISYLATYREKFYFLLLFLKLKNQFF